MKQILFSDFYHDFYDEETEDAGEKKTRSKAFALTLVILAAFLLPGLAYLANKIQYARSSYRINALIETQKQVENENRLLQARFNELSSPERIEPIAKNRLGMVPADRPPIFLNN